MKDPNVTKAILMRMPRLCRSALALVSKESTLVAARDLSDWRESAEDDVFGTFVNSNVGNCLGIVVLEPQAVGARKGVVMVKMVCTPAKAFSREARSCIL
jgi:hypothetical protein